MVTAILIFITINVIATFIGCAGFYNDVKTDESFFSRVIYWILG